jgi:hypothetical protein
VAYAYNGEGAILWDLPRTFDFNNLGDSIANVIEKFSDFGTKISSKKYNGKTQYVRGHTIVFSNTQPINQLKHRDIIHINLTSEANDEVMVKQPLHRDEDTEDEDDTEEYLKYRQEQSKQMESKYPHLFNPPTDKHIDLSQPTDSESDEEEQVQLEATEYPEITKAYKGTLIRYIVNYQTKQGGRIISKATDTLIEAQQYFNNNNYYQLTYK